ncbi:MAG TPA: isocitrate lyase/phosphoenolpyruvate mutase family protein [Dehalococcoidia bacterium]|nr:isocitrate lyase/phosphoenolpyruvate mutase family protein [Dehalococcoidia bacterium]
MPLASLAERRQRFRAVLERPQATITGSVFDAASARLAKAAGYEIGILPGSIASHAVLSAPDIVALTLTEFADQARRITRASDLPILVDADHGYGNAVNVRRTVEELETAGIAALTIEDTVLPRRYGTAATEFISRDELRDKLLAALDARIDPNLVIVGRTAALATLGLEETAERVRILSATGVDAIFVTGASRLEQFEAIHEATLLPIISGNTPIPADQLASLGVRVLVERHLPYFVMLQALYESYQHLVAGNSVNGLRDKTLSEALQAVVLDEAEYGRVAKAYLGG